MEYQWFSFIEQWNINGSLSLNNGESIVLQDPDQMMMRFINRIYPIETGYAYPIETGYAGLNELNEPFLISQ
jgi:hypothetical protein